MLRLAALLFAGYVPLLLWAQGVPPAGPDALSVAALRGADTTRAWAAAVAWSVLAVALAARAARRTPPRAPSPSGDPAPSWGPLRPGELAAVFVAFALPYLPMLLGRTGPFIEDAYFLVELQRMDCGMLPYRDFEFLYGPLMLVPLHAFTRAFGGGMTPYYAAVALANGTFFAGLMAVLQKVVPERGRRGLVFVLLVPFFFDTLLGFNWNGWRRGLPLAGALLLAVRPYDGRAVAAAAALGGVLLAYSHDYALAWLAAAGAAYGVAFLRGEGARALVAGAALGLGAAATFVTAAWLATGAAFGDYLEATRAMLSAYGEGFAGLRFEWTLHALAHFALLALACVAVGAGLLRRSALSAGDRLLLVGLLYALVGLRSGLHRADFWHLNAPFLVLIPAFLLPLRRRAFALPAPARRAALALVAAAALTHTVGLLPSGSYLVAGWWTGLQDLAAGRPRGAEPPFETPVWSALSERTRAREDEEALARWLAAPERAERPVFFYGEEWSLPILVGECKADYVTDDFLYLDAYRPSRAWLEEHPGALVVMRRAAWHELEDGSGASSEAGPRPSAAKRLGGWLTSVHFEAVRTERRLKRRLWAERVGHWIRRHYAVEARFGPRVVLARRPPPPG